MRTPAPFKLNRMQFDKIAKRFVSSGFDQRDLAIPYLIGDHIVASNSFSTILINRKKLKHPYELMAENTSTKAKLEKMIECKIINFEADISLVVSKQNMKGLIKFLKEVKREYKKVDVEIRIDEGVGLSFAIKQLDDNIESFILECEIETNLYDGEPFTATVEINHILDVMLTMKDTDSESTINFQTDPMSPMLFTNSIVQIILIPKLNIH